jgi:hypothetical protein
MPRRFAVLPLALCAAIPAVALAAPAADARTKAPFVDSTRRLQPSDIVPASSVTVPLTEGGAINVSFSAAVGTQQQLAQEYVAFLESLPHGPELRQLKLLVGTPDEVNVSCSNGQTDPESEVLGCYVNNEMTVPSTGLDTPTVAGQYSVRYVLTHEYGHHIAAHRSNSLFSDVRGLGAGALDFGPKYWSSYEEVCNLTAHRKLFPGAETNPQQYLRNPGEAWAETYARLVYPDQPWTWTPLLKPDDGALAAARRDVLEPWKKNTQALFTMSASRSTQTFTVPLTLDGSLKATVRGPSGATVVAKVTSDGQGLGQTKGRGAYGVWKLADGCREKQTDSVSFKVTRTGGQSGPVTLRVSYAG